MSAYDYAELRAKAVKFNATKEDRLALWEWMEQYDSEDWNGECYDIDGGLSLYPIYDGPDEYDCYTVVDCENR